MIVKETYISPNSSDPLIKVYSDNGFFIQYNGQVYQEVIVANEEEANKFIETSVAIPEPMADEHFICQTLVGNIQTITQNQINHAKTILLKALKTLTDNEAYLVRFFFDEWDMTKSYEVGDRVLYNNELYNVVKATSPNIHPEINTDYFVKTNRPLDLVEEWDSNNRKTYNFGEQIKIGEHFYESLLDNNTWSPLEFPASWKLIQ